MKIAITSTEPSLDATVDPRFGRCRYFVIVDTESLAFDPISNESAMESGGAGIKAAQTIVHSGAQAVITGNMGPNAFETLTAAGIKVFTGATGPIKQIIQQYKNGVLSSTEQPSVGSHHGMGVGRRGYGQR